MKIYLIEKKIYPNHQDEWYVYHSDLSHHVSDCTVVLSSPICNWQWLWWFHDRCHAWGRKSIAFPKTWPHGHKISEYSKIIQSECCICWIWCSYCVLDVFFNMYTKYAIRPGLSLSPFNLGLCVTFALLILHVIVVVMLFITVVIFFYSLFVFYLY